MTTGRINQVATERGTRVSSDRVNFHVKTDMVRIHALVVWFSRVSVSSPFSPNAPFGYWVSS
jgi:hypothetical protein